MGRSVARAEPFSVAVSAHPEPLPESVRTHGRDLSLREAQSMFAWAVGRLILHAYEQGYELTLGDAFRDPRAKYGHPKSLHRKRLAIDLNLFRDGKYLGKTSAHEPLGVWWEQLGEELDLPLRWGGRFNDGNHYSFEWNGVK